LFFTALSSNIVCRWRNLVGGLGSILVREVSCLIEMQKSYLTLFVENCQRLFAHYQFFALEMKAFNGFISTKLTIAPGILLL